MLYAVKLNDECYLAGWDPFGALFTLHKEYACLYTEEELLDILKSVEKRPEKCKLYSWKPYAVEVSKKEIRNNKCYTWNRDKINKVEK